jgi:hypothetical protein
MDRAHYTGRDTYRLIVTRPNASEISLLTRGSSCSLSSSEIPQGQQITEPLGTEFFSPCGCRGSCLLVLILACGLLKPSVAGYFRSLARRKHREAVQIDARREPCLG